MTPKYKKNDASALFLRERIKTSDCIRMRWKMSDRPPQPEKAEAGGPFLSFVSWKFWRLTIRARLSIIKLRKGAGCTVVSSLSQCHILRNMTAGVWKTIEAVMFLAILFFDIVFCVMHIPKKTWAIVQVILAVPRMTVARRPSRAITVFKISIVESSLRFSCRNIRTVRRMTKN